LGGGGRGKEPKFSRVFRGEGRKNLSPMCRRKKKKGGNTNSEKKKEKKKEDPSPKSTKGNHQKRRKKRWKGKGKNETKLQTKRKGNKKGGGKAPSFPLRGERKKGEGFEASFLFWEKGGQKQRLLKFAGKREEGGI